LNRSLFDSLSSRHHSGIFSASRRKGKVIAFDQVMSGAQKLEFHRHHPSDATPLIGRHIIARPLHRFRSVPPSKQSRTSIILVESLRVPGVAAWKTRTNRVGPNKYLAAAPPSSSLSSQKSANPLIETKLQSQPPPPYVNRSYPPPGSCFLARSAKEPITAPYIPPTNCQLFSFHALTSYTPHCIEPTSCPSIALFSSPVFTAAASRPSRLNSASIHQVGGT
jgi:hypothetical protein